MAQSRGNLLMQKNLPAAIAETRVDILGAIGDTLIARGDARLVSPGSQTVMRRIDLNLFLIYYLEYLQDRNRRTKPRDRIRRAIINSRDITDSERAELLGLSGKKRLSLQKLAMDAIATAILATYTVAGPYVLDNQQIVTMALDAFDQQRLRTTSSRGGRRLSDEMRNQFLKQTKDVPMEVLSVLAELSALALLNRRGYTIDRNRIPAIPSVAIALRESPAGRELRSICEPWLRQKV